MDDGTARPRPTRSHTRRIQASAAQGPWGSRSPKLLVTALVLVAACGSTVEPTREQARPADGGVTLDGGDASGLTAPETTADPAPDDLDGRDPEPDADVGQPDDGTRDRSRSAPRAPGAAPRPAEQTRPAAEPGAPVPASDEPIKIGVMVSESGSYEAVNNQFGGDIGSLGDNRRMAQAVIDEMNARGGLLGREIVPIWGVKDGNSATPYNQQEQVICSRWTDDHDVFAAVAVLNTFETLLACLTDAGSPFVAQHLYPYDQRLYGAYPQTFTPAMLGLDQLARAYVDRLHAQGYFQQGRTPGAPVRVGLVRYDFPEYARVTDEILRPALERHGIELDAEYAVRPDQAAQEHGNTAVEAQNAVVRFKARGISHVLLLDRGAYLAVFFTQAAESQVYRPRYGFTSYNGPGILLQDVAPNQVQDSLGVGWQPLMDVPMENQPEESAPAQKCRGLMEEAGEDMSAPLTRLVGYQYCETLWFLEQAVNRGRALTLDGFMAGATGTGTSFTSLITYSTRFGPGRNYGVAAVRDFAYSDGCACFEYTSGPRPLR